MKPRQSTPGATRQDGVILLEVLIAVLIFSVGVLAIVGMQAMSVKATTDSKYRGNASYLANQAIGRMWGNAAALASFAETGTDISALGLPGGTRTVAVAGNQVTVTITWTAPGEAASHSFVEVVQINGS